MRNPLKEEVDLLKLALPDERERLRAILKLVISRMNWDHSYRMLADNPAKRLGEGSGSSADINFVLNAALRDAGFSTTPVLLTPRSRGRLPFINPSLYSISTFVFSVQLADGTKVIVDATDPANDLDLLPKELMVDRAQIYGVM